MLPSFTDLSTHELRALADALRSGRLPSPYTHSLVTRTNISPSCVDTVLESLNRLHDEGFTPKQAGILIGSLAEGRKSNKTIDELVSLVITGPEAPGTTIRDTSVVVGELFRTATTSVMVVGYSVYQGRQIFAELGKRLDEVPELQASMYLNLPPERDTDDESIVTRRFGADFVKNHWPEGCRLPDIYFDPRSIAADRSKRASLHAKCVVVDERDVFISSANFTERAQNMNIEVGVRFASPTLARQLETHFKSLANIGALKPLKVPTT